jgi:hypothetical protein
MTKSPASSSLKKYGWPALALLSIVFNISLIGSWFYLLHFHQLPLIQAEVSARCQEPGYSHLMHQIEKAAGPQATQSKKFAAASLCFTDYDTGKSLDLDSLKPSPNSGANLPAHP